MTGTHNISPRQAHEWLASGEAILIDVREPDEFKAEHIAYAASLPLMKLGNLLDQLHMPANRKVIFQCLRGKRGEQACALASQDNGAADLYNIDGGIDAWKAAGLPVVTEAGAATGGLSIFRQVQLIVGLLILGMTLLGYAGHAWGFALAGLFGAALALAGLTGWCGLAMLLSKAPWNNSKR